MTKLIFTRCRLMLFAGLLFTSVQAFSQQSGRELYELIIYNLKDKQQEQTVDTYLQQAFIPALHRAGIKNVGAFKPVGNDTSSERKIFVMIPFNNAENITKVYARLEKDVKYTEDGKEYFDAPFDHPPYVRIEKVRLLAFPNMPRMQTPALTGPRSERVYELRSYESATEKLHLKKVKMFNEGGEIALFKRLGFNAVLYSQVLVGSHMPNLMYMTTFENKASRDEHWKAFGSDPEWKQLSAMPEYKNAVSKNTQLFLYPTDFSDY